MSIPRRTVNGGGLLATLMVATLAMFPGSAIAEVRPGDFVTASERIDAKGHIPPGYSTFTYHGMVVAVVGTAVEVKVNRIARYWNGWRGGASKPDVTCMPYTDENDVTFTSDYGSFCTDGVAFFPSTEVKKR